ncbi:MAG: hypothetical protein MRY21_05275 [Simkaniaceae bacterium]|nr:hypothetical protein [Simkaniaceae bacterium]
MIRNFLRKILFPWSFLNFLLFGLIWFFIGFSTGFSTLMGPMRDIVDWVKAKDLGMGLENLFARIIMLLFVVGSFLISTWFVRIFVRERRWHIKIFLVVFSIAAGSSSAYMMLNPHHFQIVNIDTNTFNARFAFGGYPDEKKLMQLKREGYTGVISLLSPTLPPEKVLYEKEKVNAQKVGIELIHLPMLPWLGSSNNQEAIEKTRELAEAKTGRYYVHCYLGMDRAGLIKRTVQQVSGASKMIGTPPVDNLKWVRRIDRGERIHLLDGVYFTPMPVQEELIRYVIGSNVRKMVSILDPDDSIRGQKEEAFIKNYTVPFEALPVSMNPYDAGKMLEVARKVRALTRPIVVYSYEIYSPRSRAFVQAFRSDLPSLPPNLFRERLSNGPVVVTRTNVAMGPQPTAQEYRLYLYNRGIRKVIYVGDKPSTQERRNAERAGMTFEAVSTPAQAYTKAKIDGPWYFYGPNISYDSLAYLEEQLPSKVERPDIDTYVLEALSTADAARYFQPTEVKRVIALVEKGQEASLNEERQILSRRKIPLEVVVFDPNNFNASKMLKTARHVWGKDKPIAVHYPKGRRYLREAFLQAFTADVPPAPPSLFRDDNQLVVAPNVVATETSEPKDFKEYYYTRGIKDFVYLGNPLAEEVRLDRREAFDQNVNWDAFRQDQRKYLQHIAYGGPWLVYGPTILANERKIRSKLGPAIPKVVLHYPQQSWINIEQIKDQIFATNDVYFWDDFTDRYIPPPETIILLGPLLVIYTMLCGSYVSYLRADRGVRTSYTRKVFHFLIFFLAGLLQLSVNIPGLVLFGIIVGCGVLYGCWRGAGYAFYEALARDSDGEYKKAFVIIPLVLTGLGGLMGYFFFGNFVVVGIFVTGWGDAVGEVAGVTFGKHHFKGPPIFGLGATKTLEGSFAIFLASLLAAIFSMAMLGVGPLQILWIAPIIGLLGAGMEALSIRAVDNFFVQMVASGTAYFLVQM